MWRQGSIRQNTIRAGQLVSAGAAVAAAFAATTSSPSTTSSFCEDKTSTTTTNNNTSNLRVLVTGFNDWRELGNPPFVWRCRDNPSCRLLLGAPSYTPPVFRNGPLSQILRAKMPQVDFSFQTIPTVWSSSNTLDLMPYDVVIHMGLGVYDCHDKILLEDGAFNGRKGPDALGIELYGPISLGSGQYIRDQRMTEIVNSLNNLELSGYTIETAHARPTNSYICNETHWRAIEALSFCRRSQSTTNPTPRLKAVYFVHIPYAPPAEKVGARMVKTLSNANKGSSTSNGGDDSSDYESLAVAVAELCEVLITEGMKQQQQQQQQQLQQQIQQRRQQQHK